MKKVSFGGLGGCHILSAFVHFRRSAMNPCRRRLPMKPHALFREDGVGFNRNKVSSSVLQALRKWIGTSLIIDAPFDNADMVGGREASAKTRMKQMIVPAVRAIRGNCPGELRALSARSCVSYRGSVCANCLQLLAVSQHSDAVVDHGVCGMIRRRGGSVSVRVRESSACSLPRWRGWRY